MRATITEMQTAFRTRNAFLQEVQTTAKEAYLGNLSDEWETVEKEAMALVEYMKKQIEELLRTE